MLDEAKCVAETQFNQQILAIDAKFNRYRCQDAEERKIYLKRRMQLINSRRLPPPEDSAQNKDEGEGGDVAKEDLSEILQEWDDCCEGISDAEDNGRKSVGYLQIRTMLLKRRMKLTGLDAVSRGSTISSNIARYPDRPDSLGGIEGGASPRLTEAYDFRGLHHVSDHHRGSVTQLMFAHNENDTLIASSLDGSISVFNLGATPPSVSHSLTTNSQGVTDFDLSVNNQLLVSSCRDGSLYLWNLAEGTLLRRVPVVKDQLLCCKFVPGNNNLVVCGSWRGGVHVINISTGICPQSGASSVPGSALCLAVDMQEPLVWTGSDRGTILAFRVNLQGRLLKGHRHRVLEGTSAAGVDRAENAAAGKITCLSSRPHQGSGRTMLLVNVSQNSLLVYLVTDKMGSLNLYRRYSVKHATLNLRSVFSPLVSAGQGDCVVSASEDGSVHFFQLTKQDRACINKLQAHSCPALAVCFNSDETFLATSDQSGLIIVWKR